MVVVVSSSEVPVVDPTVVSAGVVVVVEDSTDFGGRRETPEAIRFGLTAEHRAVVTGHDEAEPRPQQQVREGESKRGTVGALRHGVRSR